MYEWEHEYQLDAPGGVRIQQQSGSVTVAGWDRPTVKLRATAASGDTLIDHLHIVQDQQGLNLSVRRSTWNVVNLLSLGAERIDMELMVPVGTPCAIESSSGQISVTGTRGSVAVESSSGSVTVHDAKATTVESTSGSVRIERVIGPYLKAEVSSGSIRMAGIAVDRLEAEASSGRITVELVEVRAGGQYQIETGSGGVEVSLPADAGLSVSVETGSGRITHYGLDMRIVEAERGELEGLLNGGGAHLGIEAGSGNVTLRPLADAVSASVPAAAEAAVESVEDKGESIRRILVMVEEGKLSPDEAAELLGALDREETTA